MTVKLRSLIVRGATPGNYRVDTKPYTRWPDAPRYCPTCGCRLRRGNRRPLCDPCDDKARVVTESPAERWYRRHGV